MPRQSWLERVRLVKNDEAVPVDDGGEPHPPGPGNLFADGRELFPGDHVLLLKQNIIGLNGPWVYNGPDRDMTRPDTFDLASDPTSACTITAGPEGKNYAHSRWRATWTDRLDAVDRYDPMFRRENLVINAALFPNLQAAFDQLKPPALSSSHADDPRGGTVYFPPGNYVIVDTITCEVPVQVLLDGAIIRVPTGMDRRPTLDRVNPLFNIKSNFLIRGIGRGSSMIATIEDGTIFKITRMDERWYGLSPSGIERDFNSEGRLFFACEDLSLGRDDDPGAMAFNVDFSESDRETKFSEGQIRIVNNSIRNFTETAINLPKWAYYFHIERNRFYLNHRSINIEPFNDGFIRNNIFWQPNHESGVEQIRCESIDVRIEENIFACQHDATGNTNAHADILIVPTRNDGSDHGSMIWIARNKFGSEGSSSNHERPRIHCLNAANLLDPEDTLYDAQARGRLSRSVWITKNWFASNVQIPPMFRDPGVDANEDIFFSRDDSNVVTVTTPRPHGLSDREEVTITGVSEVSLHGTYRITVTGPSTFTYTQSGDSLGDVVVIHPNLPPQDTPRRNRHLAVFLANTRAIKIENPIQGWVISENHFRNYGILVDDCQDLEAFGGMRQGQSLFIDNVVSIDNPINGYEVFTNGGRQFGKVRLPFNAKMGDWGRELPIREAPKLHNRLRYSEDFAIHRNGWTHTVEETIDPLPEFNIVSGQTDPFGTDRASWIERPGDSSDECIYQAWRQDHPGRVYVSFWAKAGSLSSMTVAIGIGAGEVEELKYIESDTIALGEDWKRYCLSAQLSRHNYRILFFLGHEAHALAGSVYLFGVQVADHDSDYMPTDNHTGEDLDSGTCFHRQVGFTAIKALARGGLPSILSHDGLGLVAEPEEQVTMDPTSSDMAGQVRVIVGLNPLSEGLVSVTFERPYTRMPRVFAMLKDGIGNWGTASLRVRWESTSGFSLCWTNASLREDQVLYLSYFVVGAGTSFAWEPPGESGTPDGESGLFHEPFEARYPDFNRPPPEHGEKRIEPDRQREQDLDGLEIHPESARKT